MLLSQVISLTLTRGSLLLICCDAPDFQVCKQCFITLDSAEAFIQSDSQVHQPWGNPEMCFKKPKLQSATYCMSLSDHQYQLEEFHLHFNVSKLLLLLFSTLEAISALVCSVRDICPYRRIWWSIISTASWHHGHLSLVPVVAAIGRIITDQQWNPVECPKGAHAFVRRGHRGPVRLVLTQLWDSKDKKESRLTLAFKIHFQFPPEIQYKFMKSLKNNFRE